MKTKKLSYYKRKAWESFSRYIRTRDCIRTTGEPDSGKCFTCPSIKPISQLDAGHFYPGRKNIYLFDEDQVHAQCKACNIYKQGNGPVYTLNMIKIYGENKVADMISGNHQIKRYKSVDYQEIEKKYLLKTIDLIS